MEPQYYKSRCNEVLGITNAFLYPSSDKIYENWEPRYNETSLWETKFSSPLALRYIKVALYVTLILTVRL